MSDRRQLEEMTSWLVVVGRREGGRRKEGRKGGEKERREGRGDRRERWREAWRRGGGAPRVALKVDLRKGTYEGVRPPKGAGLVPVVDEEDGWSDHVERDMKRRRRARVSWRRWRVKEAPV